MPDDNPLVTIGLPVYNAERSVRDVAWSVLSQTQTDIELLISDNASTDGTEEVCRALAADDARVVYHRNVRNVGLLPNFLRTLSLARGDFFRWIGDGDRLEREYVARCLEPLIEDARIVLVTSQIEYHLPDGSTTSSAYSGDGLGSLDPVERFGEMLRLLTAGFAVIDPMYGLMRRAAIAPLPFTVVPRGDEVYAARMAMAGPWAHVPLTLATREWAFEPLLDVAPKLGFPAWQSYVATPMQCHALLRIIDQSPLDQDQARRARRAVARLLVRRVDGASTRAVRKLARYKNRLRAG